MPDVHHLTRAVMVSGPANRITFVRAGLAAAVAVCLAADAATTVVVALATLALALDLVDGWVARRTGTVTAYGARFDMEVDAALILVLGVGAARLLGWWVLGIGFARYAFALATAAWPWLGASMPAARWRKIVAATQGVALTVAISRALPDAVAAWLLAVALVLLIISFGTQVTWLHRHRGATASEVAPPSPYRRAGRMAAALFSIAIVWVALLAPTRADRFGPAAFARIPLEAVIGLAVAVLLPTRARRALAVLGGLALGALLLAKALDVGFYSVLDRPFNPITDRGTFGPALGVLSNSIGHSWAMAAVVVVAALAVAVLVLVPLCVVHLTNLASRHRPAAVRVVGVLALVWTVSATLGLQVQHDEPLASSSAAQLAYQHVRSIGSALEDERKFSRELSATNDGHDAVPARDLLTKLRGKDVLLVFVESYGQVAVQDSSIAAPDDALLRASTAELTAAGYGARSAFLTSPTFGGISWLAHATLQSGLWINNQNRYDALVASRHYTLSDAFKRAGWRTVSDVPSDAGPWSVGTSFYHYDALYNRSSTGYRGPKFGYAAIPDQYTLGKLRDLELAPRHRKPVFAEIDLVSSHTPWAPLPRMVPWTALGDGTVYAGQPAHQPTAAQVWQDDAHVQANYAQSIRYSLSAVTSYLRTFHDRNLVILMLGDHQPSTTVSGRHPTHNVPVSIIAGDAAVLNAVNPWHWQPGLLPDRSAPVWTMDAFRNHFLDAYSSVAPPADVAEPDERANGPGYPAK